MAKSDLSDADRREPVWHDCSCREHALGRSSGRFDPCWVALARFRAPHADRKQIWQWVCVKFYFSQRYSDYQ